MARVARMPPADEALAVLGPALRDPNVVPRYQVKIDAVPGSECLWWSGAVSGRGHGRKRAELASRAHLARRPAMGLASPVLTDAQLSTPLRVAGSLVLLYGQTPTRIVTLTQHDVTRLDGMTYITLHRQPVLMPTRLADLIGQLGESSTAHRRPLGSGRAGSPWLFPGARLGARQRAGHLSTSLNEQLGLQIRPGRGGALCDLADELPAAVLAALLGISVDTAGRWGALVKRDWTGYIAERDGQPSGPQQT